jgi:hypothetical protein
MVPDLGFKSGGEPVQGEFRGWIIAYDRGFLDQVGELLYTIFNDEYYLEHIEVAKKFRKQGICRKLLEALVEKEGIPYERIHWAVSTDTGRKVKKRMDKHFIDEEPALSEPPRSITYHGKTYHRMVYDAEDPFS